MRNMQVHSINFLPKCLRNATNTVPIYITVLLHLRPAQYHLVHLRIPRLQRCVMLHEEGKGIHVADGPQHSVDADVLQRYVSAMYEGPLYLHGEVVHEGKQFLPLILDAVLALNLLVRHEHAKRPGSTHQQSHVDRPAGHLLSVLEGLPGLPKATRDVGV